jgi:capsid protein
MVLRTGYNAETVDLENAADLARASKLGLNYNTLDAVEDTDDKEQP